MTTVTQTSLIPVLSGQIFAWRRSHHHSQWGIAQGNETHGRASRLYRILLELIWQRCQGQSLHNFNGLCTQSLIGSVEVGTDECLPDSWGKVRVIGVRPWFKV